MTDPNFSPIAFWNVIASLDILLAISFGLIWSCQLISYFITASKYLFLILTLYLVADIIQVENIMNDNTNVPKPTKKKYKAYFDAKVNV